MINISHSFKIICLSLISALLIACGGGGGGVTPSSGGGGGTGTGAPTINFTDVGPITEYQFLRSVDYTFTNKAESPTNPNSTVSYASSDTSVATVNEFTGEVTIPTNGATGTTLITASVTAEGAYTAGSSSYSLIVTNEVPFTAWIGSNDTQVDLPAATSGLQFYSNPDRNCRGCAGGYSVNLTGTSVTDPTATLNNVTYYTLENSGQPSDPATLSQNRFSGRNSHELIVFDNKLWLIGGVNDSAQTDIWSSSNGEVWTEETSNAFFVGAGIYDHQMINANDVRMILIGGRTAGLTLNNWLYSSPTGTGSKWDVGADLKTLFGYRYDHDVSEFNGQYWITGGFDGSSNLSDTWSSADGLIWNQATPTATYTARRQHQTVAFNGKLWLIGGHDGNYLNDIWSFDGSSWTKEIDSAEFSARRDHKLIAFNDKLWLIGGFNNVAGVLADIWSSSNGTSWTQETASAPFGPLYEHSIAVFNNRLWLAGGRASAGLTPYSNEVWSSADGSHWILEDSPSEFTGRSNVQAHSFTNKLWFFGGESETTNNEIWSSTDGISWAEQKNSAAFSARSNHQIAELNGTLWLSAGQQPDGGDNLNDIWSSSNGTDWTQATTQAAFFVRSGHQMFSSNGLLWIFGGRQDSSSYLNDAWSSSDGVNWTRRTSNGDSQSYSGRWNHQSVAYDDKLWVIGGRGDAGLKNDVWSGDITTTPITWTEVTASADFSARSKHQVVAFDDGSGEKLFLIGGEELFGSSTSVALNDIWTSTNGVNWSKQTSSANFPARHSHRIVEHEGELFLIGGVDSDSNKLKDVWKSSDGVNWRRAFSNSIFFQ